MSLLNSDSIFFTVRTHTDLTQWSHGVHVIHAQYLHSFYYSRAKGRCRRFWSLMFGGQATVASRQVSTGLDYL